jgi:hypothetical protein
VYVNGFGTGKQNSQESIILKAKVQILHTPIGSYDCETQFGTLSNQ